MCMSISAYIFAFYMIRYHEVRIFCHQYLCISVHISPYLCISVHIYFYPVYIRQDQRVSELYPCIYTYICAYLCIYVYIQKLHFDGKKTKFLEKKNRFLVLNQFSKQAGLSAPQKSKIPMSAPGIDPGTFQCHATALTTWLTLLCISSI